MRGAQRKGGPAPMAAPFSSLCVSLISPLRLCVELSRPFSPCHGGLSGTAIHHGQTRPRCGWKAATSRAGPLARKSHRFYKRITTARGGRAMKGGATAALHRPRGSLTIHPTYPTYENEHFHPLGVCH